MSANVPTDICFSFTGLLQRGGGTGPHRDGWGIVFYEGAGIRAFRDAAPSASSEIAQLVSRFPIKSCIAISHIREANVGRVGLENTHPFVRELWGRNWVFAHNGQLADSDKLPLGDFLPVGTTDSERAFCWLLQQIKTRFTADTIAAPQPVEYWQAIYRWCQYLQPLGVFNLLFSDGRFLYAYCHTRLHWLTRRAPFGEARLADADVAVDFGEHTTSKDVVTVIATDPLTHNEHWHAMQTGELVVFDRGEVTWRQAIDCQV